MKTTLILRNYEKFENRNRAFVFDSFGRSTAGKRLCAYGRVQTIAPKNTQGDTVRMKYTNNANFSFYGEKGASYKVIWDDGSTDQYTGKGPDSAVSCVHTYQSEGAYNVLLFGVTPEKK